MADLKPDKGLEDQMKKLNDYPLHPIITALQHKSGLLNMLRNNRNQKQADLDEIEKQAKGNPT